jgi:nucleoside-diphosphate-sugar epimerase
LAGPRRPAPDPQINHPLPQNRVILGFFISPRKGQRIIKTHKPHDYSRFPGFQDDARKRKWNFWGYIDARDAAQAVRLSLESNIKGAEVFIIANADTVMERANESLLKEVFPSVPHKRSFGPRETLLAIEKARIILGYNPKYSWRTKNHES